MRKENIMEIIRYILIGILTTIINYIVYKLAPYSTIVSTAIAWFSSVFFAYIANKLFVFKLKHKENILKEIIKFFSCRLFSGIIDIIIMLLFVDMLNFNEDIIKVFSNIIIIIINYVLSKYLVFINKK